MYTTDETIYLMEQSSRVLDIIYNKDEFTTSDLQGAIEAVIMSTYLKGKKANCPNIIEELQQIQKGIEGDTFTHENIQSLINRLSINK